MAAGEGVRLRPVTERYAKAVLPIDGRPVLATLLRGLAAADVRDVWLVTGHLAEQVEALAGDGSGFGLRIRCVRQPRPDGSADAVQRAVDAGAQPPFLVTAADTVFAEGDLARFARVVLEAAADGGIAVRRAPPPDPHHRRAVRVVDGRVERVRDQDPANRLAGAPLWLLGPRLVPFLCVDGAPYELANTFQRAIDDGASVAGVEIGRTRDLTGPVDLVEENFPYLASL